MQERLNRQSFESDPAFRSFHSIGLKALEKSLIAMYFEQRGSRVLDIGCGYGRTTKPLLDLGFDIVGIDVVPRMIETARSDYPTIDFRIMSVVDIGFPDASFQYALFSFNGIDYIYPRSRRHRGLGEIFRVLRPGGRCILTSHNSATLVTHPRSSTPHMMWRTLRQGLVGSSYVLAPNEGGDQITYCRMPWLQVREFRSIGFKVLATVGKNHVNPLMINLFESWPYYVLEKPR